MHGFAAYAKEGHSFARERRTSFCTGKKDVLLHGTYHQKTLQILTYIFNWLYFTHCLPSFSSIDHLLCLCAQFFVLLLSNIDEVLLINPSTNVFVFGDFNIHHEDWLTYTGATDKSRELCYNFSISNDLTHMVDFPIRILTVILTVLLFWIYLFLLTLIFVLQWLSFHWEILIMLLSQFPQTSYHIHNWRTNFIAQLTTILVLIGMVFMVISEMLHGSISLNSVLLLLLVNLGKFLLGSGWS